MQIEGWFRRLEGERLEVYLRGNGRKVRASGPEAEVYELAEWFEAKTGLRVESGSVEWRRVRTGPRPLAGQIALTEELSSPATATMAADGDTDDM